MVVASQLSIELILLWSSVLLLVAILASKASTRLGVPSLLLFLAIGMLAGEDGPGGIPFDDAGLAQSVGVVALVCILFSGGLETNWQSVSPVLWRAMSLSTLGVAVTAAITGAFAAWLLNLRFLEGMLLGAVVSSTDAAAVFAVLRSRNASLKGRTQPLLELESGSNDPMAVFLTMALIQLVTKPDASLLHVGLGFFLQMSIGLAAGVLLGRATVWSLNRIRLEVEGLYPVFTTATMLLIYSATSYLEGNGYLAVYTAAIFIGRYDFIHKKSLVRFHDATAWLMQIVMFLTLGLLVYPTRLVPVAIVSLAIAFFLMFVARPAAVFMGLAFARMTLRHKALVSWVGLRGAVPIILATFPLLAGVPNSELYFNVVFFVVLTSVLAQGTTIDWVAEKLGLRGQAIRKPDTQMEFQPSSTTRSEMLQLTVLPGAPVANRQIVDVRLPKSALVVLLTRGDQIVVPRGGTVLREGDTLTLLADRDDEGDLRRLIEPATAEE